MPRTIALLAVLVLLCGLTCTACAKPPLREIIDLAEAAKEPDFKIQGEYVGEGTWFDGPSVKAGAQVIALGQGQLAVVVTKGGLPGDGWKRGEPRFSLAGKRQDGTTILSGDDPRSSEVKLLLSGKIAGEAMSLSGADGKLKLELKRIVRHSPTEGAKPPEGAVVLFDGTSPDNFSDGTMSPDKNLMSGATSKRKFNDYTLHVEFRLSYMPEARGQARSNSGVYLHDCYEIQVLDSFGLEGDKHDCGAIYDIRQPDVNACYPPLCWQTYDVDFTAPRYQDGKKVANARATIRHNGVVIHKDFELPHGTPGRQPEGPGPRPIYLQGHGNKVEYRNIWVAAPKSILLHVIHAKEHLGNTPVTAGGHYGAWIDGCRGTLADTDHELVVWWDHNARKDLHSRFEDGKTYRIQYQGGLEDGVMGYYKGKCLHIGKVVKIEGPVKGVEKRVQ